MEMDTVRRQKSPAGAQGLADVLFEHTTSVVHVFSALVVICVVYLGWADKMTLFHWHPILYTIGWLFLMNEAIMMVSPHNIITRNMSQKTRIRCHWVTMAVSIAFCSAGFVAIYRSKGPKPHFRSSHAITGLVSACFLLLSVLNGIAALFAKELKTLMKPAVNKLLHGLCGSLTFLIGSVSLVLGFYTGYFEYIAGETVQTFCVWVVVLSTAWCLFRPVVNVFSRCFSLI